MLNTVKFIELTKGQYAIVDEEDFERINQKSWCILSQGYAGHTQIPGDVQHRLYMHREVLGLKEGEMCDHADGDKLFNSKSNLRKCTPRENVWNIGINKTNTSGYKGVSKKRNRWRARIVRRQIGSFATPEEAAKAYDAAAIKEFGEFAWLNFPEGKSR